MHNLSGVKEDESLYLKEENLFFYMFFEKKIHIYNNLRKLFISIEKKKEILNKKNQE